MSGFALSGVEPAQALLVPQSGLAPPRPEDQTPFRYSLLPSPIRQQARGCLPDQTGTRAHSINSCESVGFHTLRRVVGCRASVACRWHDRGQVEGASDVCNGSKADISECPDRVESGHSPQTAELLLEPGKDSPPRRRILKCRRAGPLFGSDCCDAKHHPYSRLAPEAPISARLTARSEFLNGLTSRGRCGATPSTSV